MKKLILLIFILLSFLANAQYQKTDTIQCTQSQIIAERLVDFHNYNRFSQLAAVTGLGFWVLDKFVKSPVLFNNMTQLQVVGGGLFVLSGVIYFDSFKHLNFKNTKIIKRRSQDYVPF